MTFLSQKGNTLIQVMVAAVIMGVISMSFMTMISQMSSAQKIAQGRQDIMNISQEMQTMFSSTDICKTALPAGMNFDASKAASPFPPATGGTLTGLPFQYKINGDTLASDATLNNYSVNASKVFLANGTMAGNNSAGDPIYRADVIAAFTPKQGSNSFAARTLASGFFTVSGGNITDCSAQSPPTQTTAAANCASLGGTYANGACTLPSAGSTSAGSGSSGAGVWTTTATNSVGCVASGGTQGFGGKGPLEGQSCPSIASTKSDSCYTYTCVSSGSAGAGSTTSASTSPTNNAAIANDPAFMAALCANLGGTTSGTKCTFAMNGGGISIGGGGAGGSSGTWRAIGGNASIGCPGSVSVGQQCSPTGTTCKWGISSVLTCK